MKYRYREPHEMKDSGVEWLGMIPKEWEISKIKYHFNIGRGRVISQEELVDEGLYPVYSSQTLNNGCLGHINTYDFNKKLITWTTDGANAGTIFIRDGKYNCTNVCGTLEKLNKSDNFEFFYHYLTYVTRYYKRPDTNGAKIMNNEMANIMCIKAKSEQQKIATFLDQKTAEFDNIIAKKESLINKLEEAKKSLISEVVTGKKEMKIENGKLTVKNRKEEDMKDSGVEWLGMIPKEWGVKRLKHLGESLIGLTYTPNDIVEENNGTLILRSSNVQNGKLSFNDNVYVNAIIPEKLRTREKDILICARNGSRALIGKNAMINKDNEGLSFGAFMTIYRSKYNDFLFYTLNSNLFVTQAGSFLTSTVNQLTVSNLNNFIISFCQNEKEQQLIVTFLDEKTAKIDSAIEKTKLQIEKLKEAKQSLISESRTGKIEVM